MKADNNQGDLFKQPISPAPSPVVGNGVPYMEIPDRQKARHCEEGAARRGNPVDFQTFPFQETEVILLFTGLPRQCAHWLAMTCKF
jgi:hypothetical protein